MAALARLGPTPLHRKSYSPVAQRMLDFGDEVLSLELVQIRSRRDSAPFRLRIPRQHGPRQQQHREHNRHRSGLKTPGFTCHQ